MTEYKLLDRWDDIVGDKYFTIGLTRSHRCDVKETVDGYRYIMQCENGFEVYKEYSTEGIRYLTPEERNEIMDFIEEQLDVEESLDEGTDWGQTEVCPECSEENFYSHWDPKVNGYIAICKNCKGEIFLCDACMHSEDNREQKCDWRLEHGCGVCMRGRCSEREVELVQC